MSTKWLVFLVALALAGLSASMTTARGTWTQGRAWWWPLPISTWEDAMYAT